MTRPRLLVPLLAAPAVLAVLLAGSPAAAQQTTPATVAAALQREPVYVDADATADVDVDVIEAEIGRTSLPAFVAVLPQAAADANSGAEGVTRAIGERLGRPALLFTVSGNRLSGGSARVGLADGEAQRIAARAQGPDTTQALVRALRAAADSAGTPTGGQQGGGFGAPATGTGTSTGAGGAVILGVLVLLFALGGGLLYRRSRTRQAKDLEGSRADVESLYHRLGADVSTLSPGDDPMSRQALADAAERYNATGDLLSRSDTPAEFAAARRTAAEGLTATRLVRERTGLDPGPDVPPPPGTGPQLQQTERVRVGEQEYEGSPQYAPGRSHYWGGGYVGGRQVPGGWYGVPFWETMLLGSVITGGLGGFGGIGGGHGYEHGYEEGVEDAREDMGAGSDGGGYDGGGDFGGGGGFGGGGDFGGGGGDFGGGGGGGDGGGW